MFGHKQAGSKPGGAVNVNCRVYSEEGANTTLDLLLNFVGKDMFQVGETVDLSKFKPRPWKSQDGKENLGVVYEGEVDIPQDAVSNIVFLQMKQAACGDKEYINRLEIFQDQDGDGAVINVAANSWIHKAQGGRFFFAKGLALLPKETPKELAAWRKAELDDIKGSMVEHVSMRQDWDRIYDYDVYNDLAGYDEDGNILDRSVLGGSAAYPYPRRIRTGRPRIRGPSGQLTYESRETQSGKFWVPLDERFNTIKESNFKAYALLALIPTVAEAVRRKLDWDGALSSFKEVDGMYAQMKDKDFTVSHDELLGALISSAGHMRNDALKLFGIKRDDLPTLQLNVPLLGTFNVGAVNSSVENINKMVGGAQNLTDFPLPLVAKRGRAWEADVEFGRQALAGVNPSCIAAVTSEEDLGSITEAKVKDQLEGHSLLPLIAASGTQPRLLVIDYTKVFPDYAQKITDMGGRYGYSGRAILFNRDDGQWVPVAIELRTSEGLTTVYTPKDHKNVWRLAKGVFLSIDSGFHQLITHWLRCHACTEPYIIATHRCLSSLHPVYKLMVPHWRFTPQINASARQSLINAKGIIEAAFTPGRYALEMSSKVYGALWRFDTQGLPADLIARGLAKRGAGGELQLLLKDYPYADDGILIWDAVHQWVDKYLQCYYDGSLGKSIAGDDEIQEWWKEIKTLGHPDKEEGWPQLHTVGDLTDILTTMIWVASAHHAAINFSQYGYTGYFLNRPTICTKQIPQKDTAAYRALIKDDASGERVYLETLSNSGVMKAVLTVELLSTHADNEVYLNEPDHPYIMDEAAKKHYDAFVAKVNDIENTIKARNSDKAYVLRQAVPYEFLMPGSGPGITNRGVPQSVSI